MLARQRALRAGSPPDASWSVDTPPADRATPAMSWTSSPAYSMASISGGSSGIAAFQWLVMSSDAGSRVNQHRPM
jgi:hypothetical protein